MIHRPSDSAIAATLVAELKADQTTLVKVCSGCKFFEDRGFAKKVVSECVLELYRVELEEKTDRYGNPTLACIQKALVAADIALMGRVSNSTDTKRRDPDAFRADARMMQSLFKSIIRGDKDKTRYKSKHVLRVSSNVEDVRLASALAGASSSDCPFASGTTDSALRAREQHNIGAVSNDDSDDADDDGCDSDSTINDSTVSDSDSTSTDSRDSAVFDAVDGTPSPGPKPLGLSPLTRTPIKALPPQAADAVDRLAFKIQPLDVRLQLAGNASDDDCDEEDETLDNDEPAKKKRKKPSAYATYIGEKLGDPAFAPNDPATARFKLAVEAWNRDKPTPKPKAKATAKAKPAAKAKAKPAAKAEAKAKSAAKAKAKPAAKAKATPAAKAEPAPNSGPFGCSKCRLRRTGCLRCNPAKTAAYRRRHGLDPEMLPDASSEILEMPADASEESSTSPSESETNNSSSSEEDAASTDSYESEA